VREIRTLRSKWAVWKPVYGSASESTPEETGEPQAGGTSRAWRQTSTLHAPAVLGL